jgi:triacylglycerol lipase
MQGLLEQQGWMVFGLDLVPANGDRGLDQLAQQLAEFVEAQILIGKRFDLVGFSMGGLVSRYYVQRLGGLDRIDRLITIASPHNGTVLAYLSQRPGCVQMRPNSRFLMELNQDVAQLARLNFTSIWTPNDLMILPATSSILPIGRNVKVQVPLHAWMVTNASAIAAVTAALEEPLRI